MVEYVVHCAPLDARVTKDLAQLVEVCFGEAPSDLAGRVSEKREVTAVVAIDDGAPVGFKLGYALNRETFYSWLGCVHPEHRRRGIARELMTRQHDDCRARGYRDIQTETLATNAAMLIANLEAGFEVHGTRTDRRGLKVLLTRSLVPSFR